jgi:hypothetical protein
VTGGEPLSQYAVAAMKVFGPSVEATADAKHQLDSEPQLGGVLGKLTISDVVAGLPEHASYTLKVGPANWSCAALRQAFQQWPCHTYSALLCHHIDLNS